MRRRPSLAPNVWGRALVRYACGLVGFVALAIVAATCSDLGPKGFNGSVSIDFKWPPPGTVPADSTIQALVGEKLTPPFSITLDGRELTRARYMFSLDSLGDTTVLKVNQTGDNVEIMGRGKRRLYATVVGATVGVDTAHRTYIYINATPADNKIDSTSLDFGSLTETKELKGRSLAADGTTTIPPTATSLTWSSADNSIVTVLKKNDSTAVVTAVGNGTTTITALFDSIIPKTIPVTVSQRLSKYRMAFVGITGSFRSLSSINDSIRVVATAVDSMGVSMVAPPTPAPPFESSEPGRAQINPTTGDIVAVTNTGATDAKIYVTSPKSDTLKVEVKQVATSVTILTVDTIRITSIGGTEPLINVRAPDARGTNVPVEGIRWFSDNELIAKPDDKTPGTITAARDTGTTIVFVRADTKADTVTVVVTNLPASIEVLPSPLGITSIDDSKTLAATLRNAKGDILTSGINVTWSSLNPAIAAVAQTDSTHASVTGRGTGTTSIIADGPNSKSDTIPVTVTNYPAIIDITPTALTLASIGDQNGTFPVVLKNGRGVDLPRSAPTWTSGDVTIARVGTDVNKSIIAVGAGSTYIVAVSQGDSTVRDSVLVTVTNASNSVEINPTAPANLTAIGATTTLTAIVRNAAGNQISGAPVTWSVASGTSVSVNATTGVVTALANGPATIQATSGTATQTVPITVQQTVSPSQSTISAGTSPIVADGVTTSLITVQLKDANGVNITSGGATVVLTPPSLGTLLGTITDNANGTYTQTFRSGTVAGTATIAGTVGGVNIGNTTAVSLIAGPANKYVVTSNSLTPTAGTSVTIRAQRADSNSNPIAASGITVTFGSTNGGTFTPGTNQAATDATGVAQITFNTNATASNHTITATSAGPITGQSPVIASTAGAPANYTVTPATTGPPAGSVVTISAQLRDAAGNPVALPGQTVTWTKSDANGSFSGSGSSTTNSSGVATIDLTTHTVAGTATTVTATTAGGITGTSATITASPTSVPADGASTSAITVQAKDALGNNRPTGADIVTIAAAPGGALAVGGGTNGAYTATLPSSMTAGAVTISATINGAAVTSGNATVTRNDVVGPTVTNVTSTTANGTYVGGQTIAITVTFSEAVTVTGTPTLTLETGTTDRTASYSSGTGTTTLTFTYTTQAGDNTADLDYAGTSALALSGGTIQDGALNNATLTLASPGAAGSLGFNKAIVIDAVAPTVTNLTSASVDGTYTTGAVINITVQFSEVVTVTGTPTLTLETGTTDRQASYLSGTGTTTLTFQYTVQAGDNTADLDYTGTSALALSGGTIQDGALNNATLTLPAPGAAGSLGANKALVIDAVVPTVTNVTATTADGTYTTGQAIAITVTFSEAVTVTGTPTLTLETGTTDRTASYSSGTGSSTLTFTYTVQPGDNSGDLDYTATTSLTLPGGATIKDAATNNATLTLAAPGAAGSLGANKALVIEAVAPTVTNVTSAKANGTYTTGEVIDITVAFSEVMTVTGTPQLELETGTTDRFANYLSGTGTNTLTFRYTVQAGDNTADLDYKATNSLTLNGGTIRDGATNNATLTLAAPGAAGSLGANKALVIEAVVPTVTNVTATTADGTYTTGQAIAITVTFSEAVTVTGTPTLTLETGTTDRTASYSSGSGSSTLTFTYTVQAGDNTADLDYTGTAALALSGGTIKDGATNDATLTLPAPGAAGSLGANKNLVIDTAVPTVTNVTSTTANGTYVAGQTIAITVAFTEAVIVSGTPELELETGTTDRKAVYTGGSGSSTLTFTYTVQAGDNSGDLDYTATTSLTLPGGATIKDAATNNATLTLAAPGAASSLGANKALVIEAVAPTVTNVTSAKANGAYTTGEIIDISVAFTEVVNVTGTPRLELETGTTDQFANYVSGTGTATLTFRYTVQAGDNTADLDYKATNSLTLNGGTIRDGANNDATLTLAAPGAAGSLGANKALVIDAIVPAVANVTSAKANGTYTTGEVIDITVTFTEAVNVTGTPRLELETGTTDQFANYLAGTGTSTLTFRYTVQAGDNTADLDYKATTSLTLNGGTIADAAGNAATLTLAAPGAAGSLGANKNIVIDTGTPTVTNVSATTANGSYNANDVISITVTFSEAVTVTGTPTLTLNTTPSRTASYSSGSGTATLTFTYTVQAGDASADLDYAATNSLALSGGTIADAGGNAANLTLPAPGGAGSLGANKDLVIDTAVPTVTGVSATTADGSYNAPDVISITVTFSEPVTVTGTPLIELETGTTDRTASYASGSGTATLTFTYTVQAGDNAADLDYKATTSLVLNGGTIRDGVNDAVLTLAPSGAAGSLGANKNIMIDTGTPTVTNVTATTANGTYTSGQVIDITVTFSEAVTVTGTPTLTLNTTPSRTASYSSGTGTATLTFQYTVQAGDNSADLDYAATTSMALNGGTIADAAGNAANLTLAAPGAAGSLGANKALVIDTGAPTVTSVSATTANGTYAIGQTINVTVTFSEVVNVTGTPQLLLETGATDRQATYASGSGTATLTFNYTVQAGDVSADLDYVATTSLTLNGGTIADAGANAATLTLPAPGGAGSLGANKAIVIDGVVPTVTNVSATTANGTYGIGQTINITVTFSEVVNVTGTPQLLLETGTTDRQASYASGSGTATLTFNYTVQAGDVSADLDYVATSSLTLNGGTIADAASNAATLTLAAPGAAGSLGANKAIVIDGVVATVTNVTSAKANGTYTTGEVIDITVTFSEAVTVTGTPQLELETGTTDRFANYLAGTGTSTLTFRYTVQAGDNTADLDYKATTSLTLNGGTIADAASNAATLTLPAPGAAGSLGANKALVIEAVAPTVTNVTSTKTNGTYGVGEVIDITVTFSEAVTVTGTPTLTLETGTTDRTASYSSGSGSTTLTFTYTVQAGDNTADLDYTATSALALSGGTIRDGANNNATLTLPAPGAAGSLGANKALVIDTPPIVLTVTSALADGTYDVTQNVDITITFSEPVAVTGTPQLELETGTTDRFANYLSGTGTATLTFRYTVQAGDNAADLDYKATTSLTLNGGTINDADGTANAANLTLASPGAAGSLGSNKNIVIDTDPLVLNVTSAKTNGTYTTGEIIDITVSFSEAVAVTGTPQLQLETGTTDRQANYLSGTGTSTLTFRYTVQAGDVSADLDYVATTSLTLNGGTINDTDGTADAANLTLTAPGAAGSLGANKALVIDTGAPTVTSVSATTANGTYAIGQTINVTVTFSEVVNVTGTPQLLLETGATDRQATYASGSGTATLTFNYTVQAGDVSADLDYVATTSLTLNGGTIADVGGNAATLTLAAPGAANSLGANKAIVIDGVVPTVTNVTSAKADGTYTVGEIIDITVTFTEAVTVTGTPLLELETGTTDQFASYISGTGTTTLTFRYTVQPGDNTGDLDYKATTSLTLNGGTIADAAGNAATLTLAAPGAAGSLGANKALVIETVAPTVTNVTSAKANGTYTTGEVIDITVTFSEVVNVTGTPQLELETGTTDRQASYLAGTGTNTLTFRYTVQSGDASPDLDYTTPFALTLNGGTIRDAATNDANLTLPAPGAAGSLGANKALVIEAIAPTVMSVTSSKTNGTYTVGEVIDIIVSFSEAVTVTGTPTLTLETGTIDRTVSYSSGSGSSSLIFTYTVQAGDNSADLDYVATNSLALNGGTIRDAANNDATLTLPAPGAAESLGANKALVIDTPPIVRNVTSALGDGTYDVTQNVDITITFSEPVAVTGTPQLELETGTTDRFANYLSGTGTNTLTFRYTVQAGDNAADLDYKATTSLTLNGGTIADQDGTANAANLTLATPGAANSLGGSKNIVIDTDPIVLNVTSAKANGTYTTGEIIDITVSFSEAVTVTGTPQLELETGTTDQFATYNSGSGTATLTFRYTVQAGDNTADLDYKATNSLTLNGGTINDADGTADAANLTLVAPGAAGSLGANKALVIDAVLPTVTNVTSAKANGTYSTGEIIDITVTFSEVVNVTGTPQLELETGTTDRLVNYLSGTGTNTLTFRYTVQAGDNTADLDYKATTSLTLNGGTITDAAGNAATLTLAAPGAPGSLGANKALVIDTPPIVLNVTSALADGTYDVTQNVDITITFSEVVNVTGTPQLELETGTTDRFGNYLSGTGTNTLTFRYTVQAGDNTADLDYKATASLTLNGGTINDGDGTADAATLTLAAPGAAGSLGANKAIVIDTDPIVLNVTSAKANGSYTTGEIIDITVSFSEVVNVTGTPQLELETGTTDRQANYLSGTGTATLTFRYTVQTGDISADLDYKATTSLTLNLGTINDADGTADAANLTLPAPGGAGSLGANKALVIATAPAAPVAAAASSITETGFTANWSTSTTADEYRLDVSTASNFSSFVGVYENFLVSGGGSTSQAVTLLSGGTTYYYRVRAANAGGTSPNSSTITVLTVPPAPVANDPFLIGSNSFTANWNTSTGASSYRLDVATDVGFTSFVTGYSNLDVGSGTTRSVTGLTAGTTYHYRVRAVNASGTSGQSNVITTATLAAPVATAATSIAGASFSANWNAYLDATSYRLDVSTDNTFVGGFVTNYQNRVVAGGSTVTQAVTGLAAATQYHYRIRAIVAGVTSTNSNIISATTFAADGSGTNVVSPTTASASSTGNRLTFTYTAAVGGMSSGTIEITVPSGWSAPSTTSTDAGYTTSSHGTVGVAGQIITISGVTLAEAAQATIVYGAVGGSGATAQATTGTATFTTRHRSTAFGTLTAIAASPTVTVFSADGSGDADISPLSVSASALTTQTLTYTAATGGMAAGGQVTLVIPAGWTAPQITTNNAAGYTRVSFNGGGRTTTGLSVAGSAVTYTLSTALNAGETIEIFYGDGTVDPGGRATVAATTGTSDFDVDQRSTATGTLTDVAGDQLVTVFAADGSGEATIAPTSVTAGTTTTETMTYTAATGGMQTGGQITMVVPANWSAPQTTTNNAAGYTTVSVNGGLATTTGISVSGSGPWLVTYTLQAPLAATQTIAIVYGDNTVPGGAAVVPGPAFAGNHVFQVQQKATTMGALANVSAGAGTQTVTVNVSADGSGDADITPLSVSASAITTQTLTYTAATGGVAVGGVLQLTIPAGWTTPQTTTNNAAGYTTVSFNGGGRTTTGLAVVGSTITYTLSTALDAGQTIEIFYGDNTVSGGAATVTATTGPSIFDVEQRSTSGGLFTDVAGDKTVTVFAADGSGEATISPTSVTAGTTTTETMTYVAATGGMQTGGQITMVVPAGWSAPQTTTSNAAGYTTVSVNGGGATTTGLSISGSGPWLVTYTLQAPLAATQTIAIIYGDNTVPGGAAVAPGPSAFGTPQVFQVQQRSTTMGVLANVSAGAGTQTVTINVSADGSGTANITPTSVLAGTTQTETMTYTATSGGMAASGQITMVVPANWSAPQIASNSTAGYTTASISGGGFATTDISISGAGPWTITYTLPSALNSGETIVIRYGDATGNPSGAAVAPSAAQTGAYLFQVQSKSTSGGTLTNVAGTQTVTVTNSADGSGSAIISPTEVSASATVTETVTYTAATGGMGIGGQVTMMIPANWSEPQTTTNSTAGYTRADIAGGGLSTANITISGAGPWTVTVTLPSAINAGETVIIVYGDASVNAGGAAVTPAATGTSNFQVQQKSTGGGLLTDVGTQTVTVFSANGSGSANITPTSVLAGTTQTETMTYTAAAGGMATGGQITMVVPANWSAPQNASNSTAGFTRVNIDGGGLTTSNISISGSGPWTVTVTLPSQLLATETVVLVYGDATGDPAGAALAPSAAQTGAYLFQVQQKSTTSGTLTNVAGTQNVTVTNSADGSGTANITPTTVLASTTQTETMTYTAADGGMGAAGQITMIVPANWSAPQTAVDALAGYTRANIAGGGLSTNDITITGAGPWTVTVTLPAAINAGQTVIIVYGDASLNAGGAALAPSAAQTGNYDFNVQQKSTGGGLLTDVAGTQVVAVSNSVDGSGTANILPITALAATQTTHTMTYTSATGGMSSGGQVTMVVPAGWSAPQILDGSTAGFTQVSIAGGAFTTTPITISGAGPWTVTVTLAAALNATETIVIRYGDTSVNANGAAVAAGSGSYLFQVKQKSTSGGTLTNVAGTQTVTVP